MTYKTRKYPQFAACGLNCGLCPRYYTSGSSRCPGCGGVGFTDAHCGCGMLSCCQRKELEYCFECNEFPCEKYKGVDKSDSFISHKNQFVDMEKAKRIGLEAYIDELNEKIAILETLLQNHDNGRNKSFYCTAVNLLELEDVKAVMNRIDNEVEPKAVRQMFEEMAECKEISLKLRK